LLIRWAEIHGHKPEERLVNLENDLKDGQLLARLIMSFVKSEQVENILTLKTSCTSEAVIFIHF
jgi:hypothetical protein